jgi:two-component system sensor histidine kinase TctE
MKRAMARISSLRARLLVGIMVPALTLIALDGISVYSTALAAANTAYDRTLLASA